MDFFSEINFMMMMMMMINHYLGLSFDIIVCISLLVEQQTSQQVILRPVKNYEIR